MSGANCPETVGAADGNARLGCSSWLGSVVSVTAAFGIVSLWNDRTMLAATLPELIFSAVLLAVVAIFVGSDGPRALDRRALWHFGGGSGLGGDPVPVCGLSTYGDHRCDGYRLRGIHGLAETPHAKRARAANRHGSPEGGGYAAYNEETQRSSARQTGATPMDTTNYSDAMATSVAEAAEPSPWAKLRRGRTKAEMIVTVPVLFLSVAMFSGVMGWLFATVITVCWIVWVLLRPLPPPPATTPAENRAATELRWAQGAERDRQRRAAQAAEYECAAEQRRQEGAARRAAEASARTDG